jgi:TonB family protein
MQLNQTGVFYANKAAAGASKPFPMQYRRRFGKYFDRQFTILLVVCGLVLGLPVLLLSYREPTGDLSDKEIKRIQERYAQLVLNQPKPEPAEEDTKGSGRVQEQAKEDTKEEEKIDRAKESVADKQARRERTREDRQRRREQISKEVGSAGIFAAITSAAGSGGSMVSGGVSDLLGAANAASNLDGVAITGGSFATRNVDPSTLTGRRGERTTGVGIERTEVGRVEERRIASAGSVNITSEPPAISGDQTQVESSQACINSTIVRERAKIKRVFETWLKRDPQLGGRLKVKFTIMGNGTVANVIVIQSTTNNSRFDSNVTRYISQWDFSACAVGSALEVELPFVFEGQS